MESKKTIFADHAEKLNQLGLAVIPCGDQTGKKPLVRWRHFSKKGVPSTAISKWVNQFPTANIGVLLGEASGIVVIDDDNNREPNEIFEEFGPTPIYVRTPSKGGHYYYRYNGEISTNIASRRLEIKSTGSFVIVPPSISPNNGNTYEFVRGRFTLGFIDGLPQLAPKALEAFALKETSEFCDIYQKGERNNQLFKYLCSIGHSCDNEKDLIEAAFVFNNKNMETPLSATEVQKTAKSVWKYKLSGNLYPKGIQSGRLSINEINQLTDNELRLLAYLRASHKGLRPEFFICPEAMSTNYRRAAGTIRTATNALIKRGILIKVHQGTGKGNPSKYMFSDLTLPKD